MTGEFLDYFARRATNDDPQAQRIGLTSLNRRVIPMTRDHQYVAAQARRLRRTAQPGPAATFAPAVLLRRTTQPSVEDVLALCIPGFPVLRAPGAHTVVR